MKDIFSAHNTSHNPSLRFNFSEIIETKLKPPTIPPRLLCLHYGNLTDGITLRCILEEIQPNEIYYFGAQSHVRVSFDRPITGMVDGLV